MFDKKQQNEYVYQQRSPISQIIARVAFVNFSENKLCQTLHFRVHSYG